MTVLSHTASEVCYSYSITNVGTGAPSESEYDPYEIFLKGYVEFFDEVGEHKSPSVRVGGKRLSTGPIPVPSGKEPATMCRPCPEEAALVRAGASFRQEGLCGPYPYKEEDGTSWSAEGIQDAYEHGLDRGRILFHLEMYGQAYATHVSDRIPITHTTTTTKSTTAVTKTTITTTKTTTKTATTTTAITNTPSPTPDVSTPESTPQPTATTPKQCLHPRYTGNPNPSNCTSGCVPIVGCGPKYGGMACRASTSPYCNEENGWCGIEDAHKNNQASTEYDYCEGVQPSEGATTTSSTVGDDGNGDDNDDNGDDNGDDGDDDDGDEDDAGAGALDTLAVVNKRSLIVGVVFGVIFLVALSVGVTTCIQRRNRSNEDRAIPTTAVLTNFKARDRTAPEAAASSGGAGAGAAGTPGPYYSEPGPGNGAENAYAAAEPIESEGTYSTNNPPSVPLRRPQPPPRGPENMFVNPAFSVAAGAAAVYEYGEVAPADPSDPRSRLGSVANPSYEVPVSGGGGGANAAAQGDYECFKDLKPAVTHPRADGVDGSGDGLYVDDGYLGGAGVADAGTGVVYAVYAGSKGEPDGEDASYEMPDEYVQPNGTSGTSGPYELEPAVATSEGTTAGDTIYAYGDAQMQQPAVATSKAFRAATSTQGSQPQQAVGWQDSDNAYMHARTASKRHVVYAIPMDSTV